MGPGLHHERARADEVLRLGEVRGLDPLLLDRRGAPEGDDVQEVRGRVGQRDGEGLVVRGGDAELGEGRIDVRIRRGRLGAGHLDEGLGADDRLQEGLVGRGGARVGEALPRVDEVGGDDRVAVAVLRVAKGERVVQAVSRDLGELGRRATGPGSGPCRSRSGPG